MLLALPVIFIAVVCLLVVWRRRRIHGAVSLMVFSIALALWAAAYGFFLHSSASASIMWLSLIYLSATVTSTSLLVFSLFYTNHGEWVSRWSLPILAIEPLLTQVFIWTLRWRSVFFTTRPDTLGFVLTAGPWYWINQTYVDGLSVLALIFIAQTFLHKSKRYQVQSLTIVAALIIPIFVKILSLTEFQPFPDMDLAPFASALTAILLIFCVLRFRFLDIGLISRETVVESMSDGWMVIDNTNRIVDLNPAAETLLGVSREDLFGEAAEKIMSNWPKLNQELSAREVEIRGSLKLQGEWRFLNVRILPLIEAGDKMVGNVVLWRDITERKKSDDARQHARDEMFVLLHTISGAASQTLSLNEFLSEAMRQIVYAFQSQVSLIFLLESGLGEGGNPKYTLAAQHGVGAPNMAHLLASAGVGRILGEVIRTREPFFVPDVTSDPRLPASMQQSGNRTLLLVPLITAQQSLGVMGLARMEGLPFGPDELTRLTVVAEEIASLIYSDRQRQLSIALEERQRLVRDLHDSVTQKLYGLVQLTEAAKASLENGTPAQSLQVVSRIGENARQALKEMRLFLFEMKPVDIEREGLVSVLHQRLAAVEGRADIRARLVADDKINLTPEAQVTFYFIAQEALNNILKHGNASSVMIRLKNRKASYALEIEDDGCGFDPQQLEKGGMGLRIMQERAAKVDGKVTIKSAPGKGTKITATVAKQKLPVGLIKRKKQ